VKKKWATDVKVLLDKGKQMSTYLLTVVYYKREVNGS